MEGGDVHMVWRCVCGVDVYMQCGCVHMCGCVHVVWGVYMWTNTCN